jgi:DNA-binding NarL/FixJ family response regulator
MKIRIMIVDDQVILSEGIKSVLETCQDFEISAMATDGFDALEKLKNNPCDVVLLDIRMPNMNGVVATESIKKLYPDIKVIILTTFDDSDYILDAINNGASGYLLKDIGAQALIDAIKNAYKGDTILPTKIAKKIADAAQMVSSDREIKIRKAYNLSEREIEIALMLYEGFTNRQIAAAVNLSEGTARNYISTIYLKLGSENRTDAIAKIKDVLQN